MPEFRRVPTEARLPWESRAAMTKLDVEIILQRAGEKYPDTSPRIIADNGPSGYQTQEIPPYSDAPVAGIERTDAFGSSIAHRLDRGSIDLIRPASPRRSTFDGDRRLRVQAVKKLISVIRCFQ
jgi:hypothetical protein